MAIRVFHADDHQTFRDGMRLILEREPDIEVVGSSGDTGEAFKMISKLKPDVALLDLSMPGLPGEASPARSSSTCVTSRTWSGSSRGTG